MKQLEGVFQMPKSLLMKQVDAVCQPIKEAGETARGVMKSCNPDVMKKVDALCSGDGKGEGDGKDGEDGKGGGNGDKGDGEGDKGDGKGDDEGDKGDGKDACAAIADIVRSC